MPPQEKLPAQEARPEEDMLSQQGIRSSSGSVKSDEGASGVAQNPIPYHESVSVDRIPEITAINTMKTETLEGSEQAAVPTSTWAAVKLKMSRQSSLADGMRQVSLEEKSSEKEPPSPLTNAPNEEDKQPSMDFDDMLPLVGEFGVYQKILFLLLMPFAFFVTFVYFTQIFITVTPEQYWCKVPELDHLHLTEEQT